MACKTNRNPDGFRKHRSESEKPDPENKEDKLESREDQVSGIFVLANGKRGWGGGGGGAPPNLSLANLVFEGRHASKKEVL